MVKKNKARRSAAQQSLFPPVLAPPLDLPAPNTPCDIFGVEKRRDGGTRYWCRIHRADATAKGGVAAPQCRLANTTPLRPEHIKTLHIEEYRGGVALWGAVPAVYDTTLYPIDRGIHIHARVTPRSKKELDYTYPAVQLLGKKLPPEGVLINESDAIYYMVSSVFGFGMSYIPCTHCGFPHLDKDWFSVHPHRKHLCAGCGCHFHDRAKGIGNPIVVIREVLGVREHRIKPAAKKLNLSQKDYPGGIQIWGSNPAFLWTQPKHEEEGIHVHAFKTDEQKDPDIDDTFSQVRIDGRSLDPKMVRVLMAQNVLSSLKGRVKAMSCTNCGSNHFDEGEAAYTPSPFHHCGRCKMMFPTKGRKRNMVANPLTAILEELETFAVRSPQRESLDLMPETL